MAANVNFHKEAWRELSSEVIAAEGVPRMKRVADAANENLDHEGYMVSVDGAKPLRKRDFRATVITATAEAMRDNQKHNRLVVEFYRAGGA